MGEGRLPVYRSKAASQLLVCFSDLHLGSFNCDLDKARDTLEKYRKRGAWFVGGGDMIEAASRYSVGSGVYEQHPPQHQYEEVIELLRPYADSFIGLHAGNHEERITKAVGLDITKVVCDSLSIRYLGHSTNTRIEVGDQRYIMFSTHGSSGGTTPAGRMRAVEKLVDWTLADLYLYGHTHAKELWTRSYREYDSRNKNMETRNRWFCLMGSFLKWGGYAEAKNYPPLGTDVSVLELMGDEKMIRLYE